jgi:hypothetical protein
VLLSDLGPELDPAAARALAEAILATLDSVPSGLAPATA